MALILPETELQKTALLRSEKGRRLSVTETTACTYETIYYTLWELAQRYGEIAQFRVIGKSHDDRMIPMLELGTGDSAVICLSGLRGTERLMPSCLVWMAAEYCQAWECRWNLEDIYDVRQLFSDWKLCFIPVLNPDGYEIYEKDYTVIRNPIYRKRPAGNISAMHEGWICAAIFQRIITDGRGSASSRQAKMKRKLSSVCFRKIPAEAFFLLAIRLKRLSASGSPDLFP